MGKIVLITGGSRGIGAAAVRLFGQAGWSVGVGYHVNQDAALALVRDLEGFGVRAAAFQGDVSRPAQARSLVEQAQQVLGPLDALVCNAGAALPQQLLTDTTQAQWQRILDVNLSGVFYTIQAALPQMVHRKQGSIVTVSSMWGVTGGSCEVPYSAAKAGVIGLTKALAKELGPSGIRVNCVAPGVIDTDMNRHLDQEALDALAEETPLCRIGTPEEAAQCILFLAGEGASFLTGQVLQPNGGLIT